MIKVVMIDLGGTLIRKTGQDTFEPFPNADSALETLGKTKRPDGGPLLTCLVSDFQQATSPEDVGSKFEEFIAILDSVGLRRHFEPVNERITLSTHAGVRKPDRKVFELALKRLGSKASLLECLLITEDKGHIVACNALGMRSLQFGGPEEEGDFHDWKDAPRIVFAHLS